VAKSLLDGDIETAKALLDGLTDSPQTTAVLGALAIIERDATLARTLHLALIQDFPADACLLRAASLATFMDGEVALARTYAEDAFSLSPEDAEAGFQLATLVALLEGSSASSSILRRVLSHNPGHSNSMALLGMHYLQQGDALLALPLLEGAAETGAIVDEILAPAYFGAGQIADYLRLASRADWPLGDEGQISKSDDPLATYFSLIGADPSLPFVATIRTSDGPLRCVLFPHKAPVTVANFVGLSKGHISWVHPETGERMDTALYPGTILHRVIPEFMIQGGDPTGTGAGHPGYRFPDEIHPTLRFDKPGVLAMANSGANTNGSQWFITEVATPHLTGRHTIFGQCDDVSVQRVKSISMRPTGADDRLVTPIEVLGVEFSVSE